MRSWQKKLLFWLCIAAIVVSLVTAIIECIVVLDVLGIETPKTQTIIIDYEHMKNANHEQIKDLQNFYKKIHKNP